MLSAARVLLLRLEFRLYGLGVRVWGLGVQGLGFGVWGFSLYLLFNNSIQSFDGSLILLF